MVGPGWLLLRAIAPGIAGRPWQIALGWPLGLTVEVLAFSLTAALGIRDAFLAYPLAVALPAGAVVLRRRERPGPSMRSFTPAARWVTAGLSLLALAFIGVAYYTTTPLPGSVPGVVYPGDSSFHIAVAASALHHWPPEFLGVSGQSFDYHYFANLHMAAISQVTDIDLSVIVTRLYDVPLTALLVLQLALAGRLLGSRAWAGPVTVALFLLVREIDLAVSDPVPFAGVGIAYLWTSPSQLLGTVLFIPALVILALLLDPKLLGRSAPRFSVTRRQLWIVLGLLLVGAAGAKSVILPMLIGALVLFLAWTRWRAGRFDTIAIRALVLTTVLATASRLILYRSNDAALGIDPLGTIRSMPPLARLHEVWPSGLLADFGYWVLAVPAGTAMYFAAPLIGLALWLRLRARASLEPAAVLSISLLVAGAAAFFLLSDEYFEQIYFTHFGLIAVMPLAAAGLLRFAEGLRASVGSDTRRIAALAVVWTSALIGLAFLADRLVARGHYVRADAVAYLPVIVVIAVLAAAAARWGGRARQLLAAGAVAALLSAAAVDAPLDVIPNTIRQLERDAPLYTASRAGLRPRELEGMEWIRDHLPGDALLSVSNDRTPGTFRLGPIDGDYPALTERRTFREAWSYTGRANEIGQRDVAAGRKDPFPHRTALERRLFTRADPGALREMRRLGVTHLVISRKDGPTARRVYGLGALVFSNGAVDVIDVR